MVKVCKDSFSGVDVKMADITAFLFNWPSVRAGALENGRISFGEVKVSDLDGAGEVVAVCRRSESESEVGSSLLGIGAGLSVEYVGMNL